MNPRSRLFSLCTLSVLCLLGAFLLFQVQPLISKLILPWFGGSPAVWTTCMLFFQSVLFLGYAYAHGLRLLPRGLQAAVHAGLLLATLASLPIAPASTWKPTGLDDPQARILALLLRSVGLPYLVLAGTSPMAQVWLVRLAPGASPWRLYALSNAGSLVALLSFPFFFEPRFDAGHMATGWSVAFVVFVVLSLVSLRLDRANPAAAASHEPDRPPPLRHRVGWVLLPALACAVLLATTNHVCQDVAVVPLVWVVPLSLYLVTFIICFERERWYVCAPALWSGCALPVLLLVGSYAGLQNASWWPPDLDLMSNYLFELGWAFAAMFLACMLCHGELVLLKPSPGRLTSFYLHVSAGGALGGLVVSLGAPRLLATHGEWPGALLAAFVLACLVLFRSGWRQLARSRRGVLCVFASGFTAASAAGVVMVATLGFEVDEALERTRNFYGALVVYDEDAHTSKHRRELLHGTVIHGTQYLSPARRSIPTTYYGRRTGIGKALASLAESAPARVGVVGMGAGTVASYARPADTYRFYEINPSVLRIARTYFTYLSDLERRGARLEVVIADARLALEREVSQGFDVLLLDAFTGDSVPAHLLTREAFVVYLRHMGPEGIIAVHVSNIYLHLAPLVETIAASLGLPSVRITTEETPDGLDDATDYVLITRSRAFLSATPPVLPQEPEPTLEAPLWTDGYHSLFEVLDLGDRS